MLLGDTLILDDLDCANRYRQEVSTQQQPVTLTTQTALSYILDLTYVLYF